jgi:NAD(P)H-nitrite reductase large subunit
LPLAILGAPVSDAETVSYSRPSQGIHREFFIRENRLVGGALIGDISGAGPIHAGMVAGRSPDDALLELLKPQKQAFTRRSWNHGGQIQRALFISA